MRAHTWLAFIARSCLLLAVPGKGTDAEHVQLYFGAGCFWHIQHVFVEAEKSLLKRNESSFTAFAGYAGATASTPSSRPCYTDSQVHAEVVGFTIPNSSVAQFASVYFGMFVGHDRSHTNDRGPAYRAVIGLPGGISGSLFNVIKSSQPQDKKWELREGKGDDADTLGSKHIWVYDSTKFPFYQAEIYHQFHNDYLPGGVYGASYNSFRSKYACLGKLQPTLCLNDGKENCDILCGLGVQCKTITSSAGDKEKGGSNGTSLSASSGAGGNTNASEKGGSGAHDDAASEKGGSGGNLKSTTGGNVQSNPNVVGSGVALVAPASLIAFLLASNL